MDLHLKGSGRGVRITGLPPQALIDAPIHLRLHGLAPQQQVTVRARMQDDAQRWWESFASFVADARGEVDLTTQRPLAGSYDDVDPMGLFWSMSPNPGEERSVFAKVGVAPTTMTFTVEVEDVVVASATHVRVLVGSGVRVEPVRAEGLAGVLFLPPGPGPHPGILVVGGSGGGLRGSEQLTAVLASHGYAALALAYFAYEHLPAALIDIPLEYFETAMRWLQQQEAVMDDRLAVVGTSRGGELALLLGATFPRLTAVVAYVPSGVIWGGFGTEVPDVEPAAWTYGGARLPFVPDTTNTREALRASSAEEAIAFTPTFLANLENTTAVAAATIPVERTSGPLLLISGQDDQMWPSATMAERVVRRLKEHAFPFTYRHLSYAGAGHVFGLPYLPATVTEIRHPIAGQVCALGGNARETAAARRDAWEQMLAFLRESLGQ